MKAVCNTAVEQELNQAKHLANYGSVDIEERRPKKRPLTHSQWWAKLMKTLGPGLMVCLADTDGASLITAASSGAEFQFTLVSCELILIPILYWAVELSVRLAAVTGKGLTELVKEHYGDKVALLAVVVLAITCLGAIISEMSCIAQVGMMWDIPAWVSALCIFGLLLGIGIVGSYRQVVG
jgi:Mn2+/Fe2+ NRAMP family transporter